MADVKEDVLEQEDASAIFDSITGSSPEQDADDGLEAEKTLDQADEEERDEPETGDADDQDDGDTPETEKPEPAAAKTPAATEQIASDDPFAEATPEQRKYLEQLKLEQARAQNAVRASAGKISHLSKQVNELMQAQKKAAPQADTIKLEGKSFEEVERDWPELAEYVRAHVIEAVKLARNGVQQDLQPVLSTYQQLTSSQQQEQVIREREALSQAHPDFVEINTSYDFENWLAQQPDTIAQLRSSMRAVDNIKLLNLYKAETGRLQAPASAAPKQTRPDLSAHAELPRKSGQKPETLPDDPEEYFNYITRKR